ncbi:MAG TPA: glycosyltransferase family A protein, partial [Phycisphaerae bacterium]|nr:glycosyltransferase family A protein [Phycisphaerae bacterium]
MLKQPPDCTVIIPTRNRRETLSTTLEQLLSLPDANFEVIAVDNASTDGTAALAGRYRDVRWIRLSENAGAAARNAAAREARGRILFMLDDDSWPEPGVIATSVKRLDACDDLAAIACRVLLAGHDRKHDAGGVPGI